MDLFIGEWRPATKEEMKGADKVVSLDCLRLGSYCVERRSSSLLKEKCELMLQVERNLSDNIYKSGMYESTRANFSGQVCNMKVHILQILVPDMSFTGVLSTLAVSVDFSQYLLLRGLLMFNIGECLDDLLTHDEEIANSFYQVSIFDELTTFLLKK